MQVLADHKGDLPLWLRFVAQQPSQQGWNAGDVRKAYHLGLQVLSLSFPPLKGSEFAVQGPC